MKYSNQRRTWTKHLLVSSLMVNAMLLASITHAQQAENAQQTAQASSAPAQHNKSSAPVAKAKHDYGERPNIFAVLGHKTQEKVTQGAQKVGDVTQKGIEKVKPMVSDTWDAVTGGPAVNVPVEQKPLSQSSNNQSNAAPLGQRMTNSTAPAVQIEAIPDTTLPKTPASSPTSVPSVPVIPAVQVESELQIHL